MDSKLRREIRIVLIELYKRDDSFLAMLNKFEGRLRLLEKKGRKGAKK